MRHIEIIFCLKKSILQAVEQMIDDRLIHNQHTRRTQCDKPVAGHHHRQYDGVVHG